MKNGWYLYKFKPFGCLNYHDAYSGQLFYVINAVLSGVLIDWAPAKWTDSAVFGYDVGYVTVYKPGIYHVYSQVAFLLLALNVRVQS